MFIDISEFEDGQICSLLCASYAVTRPWTGVQFLQKIIFIRFRGAGDLSQKVQMKLFCYWDILFLIISNIFYACRSLSSRRTLKK